MRPNFMVGVFDRVARGNPLYRRLLTPVAPVCFFGFIAALVYGALQLEHRLGLPRIFPEPWNLRLSRPFMFGGFFLMSWSASCFFRARGTPVPFNPPRKLVTTGPYAWTRNPMMTGLFSVLFGGSIRLQSTVLLVVFLPLFIALIGAMLRKVEEPGLEQRFGDAYLAYKRVTPRFFPRIGRKNRSI